MMQDKIKHIFDSFGLTIPQVEKTASEQPLEKKAEAVLSKLNEAINTVDIDKVASGISNEESMILSIVKEFQSL